MSELNSEGLVTYIDFLEMEGLLGAPESQVFKEMAQKAGPWERYIVYAFLSVLGDLRALQRKINDIEKKLEGSAHE